MANRLEEKAQEFINSAEQTALSVSDVLIEQGIGRATDLICALIPRIYPPATVVIPYINRVKAFITPIAKTAVKKGIRMVAETARNVVSKASAKVKSFAKKAIEKLFG